MSLSLPEWADVLPLAGLVAYLVVAFIAGGVVKGTLGVGLPLSVVPILSLVLPAPTAISIMAVPVLASNLWQAFDSEAPKKYLLRFAPLSATLVISTLITVPLALSLSSHALNILVALSVLTAVALMAFKPQLRIQPRHEKWTSALVGVLAGIMGGVSSMTGPIIITYLVALKLPREAFIGCISIIYLFGIVPLYGSLIVYGRLGLVEAVISLIALIPMFVGMAMGKRIRHRLSEVAFQRLLLSFLALLAVLLMVK